MTTFFGKAYTVSTSTTSANQNLSDGCRKVRIHVATEPVVMGIGNIAQTAAGDPAEAVAVVTAAAADTAEVRKVTLSGFYEAGDQLTVVVAGTSVTYEVTGADQSDTSSTTLSNVAASVRDALNANSTISADLTATASGAVVTITHGTDNTAFTLTAEVVANDDDDHYLAINQPYDIDVAPSTSLAFKTLANTGNVYISELS
jgi:hypothetical protein|tara:strand:+ start:163 stop:768 length:606 start_codon:yes stop_codon:yes gene_type:complete